MSVNQWGSELGKRVLTKLSLLYTYLVWESSVLLTLCTPNLTDDEKIDFARDDLTKLVKDMKGNKGWFSNPLMNLVYSLHLTRLEYAYPGYSTQYAVGKEKC